MKNTPKSCNYIPPLVGQLCLRVEMFTRFVISHNHFRSQHFRSLQTHGKSIHSHWKYVQYVLSNILLLHSPSPHPYNIESAWRVENWIVAVKGFRDQWPFRNDFFFGTTITALSQINIQSEGSFKHFAYHHQTGDLHTCMRGCWPFSSSFRADIIFLVSLWI